MNWLFAIYMGAIISGPQIEKVETLGPGYFLKHQLDWIRCEDKKALWEKSVRVGATFCDGFKQVRKRLENPKRDYLFVTKDQPTAFEYIENCLQFLEIFNLTSEILSHGIEEMTVPVFDAEGEAMGLTEKINVGMIKLSNKSRILAFSSNPNAVRAYGGDFGWDEAAFHPRAVAMWSALQGRARWGFDMGVWSSHNQTGTFFYEMCDLARDRKNKWSYFRTDIHEAVANGLAKKVNEVMGTEFTDEEYIEDCKAAAIRPQIYEQEYELKAAGALDAIVTWERIQNCRDNYDIERAHLSEGDVVRHFGAFTDPEGTRKRKTEQWIRQAFPNVFSQRGKLGGRRWCIGFDVAASGEGDLASIKILEKAGPRYVTRGLLTFQTTDWDVMEWALGTFFSYIPGDVVGAGDETGLGRQVCWRMMKFYYGRFYCVNFAASKGELGSILTRVLTSGDLRLPKDNSDIAHDYYAIRVATVQSKKAQTQTKSVYTQSKNQENADSHCDIAWSGALAIWADENRGSDYWVL